MQHVRILETNSLTSMTCLTHHDILNQTKSKVSFQDQSKPLSSAVPLPLCLNDSSSKAKKSIDAWTGTSRHGNFPHPITWSCSATKRLQTCKRIPSLSPNLSKNIKATHLSGSFIYICLEHQIEVPISLSKAYKKAIVNSSNFLNI